MLALSLKPDHEKAMNNLGLAYEALGDRPAAGRWYREAMKLQPGDGAAANNLAYLYADQPGALDKALELAERAA
jgi:Flp pilus assembly protein TadD